MMMMATMMIVANGIRNTYDDIKICGRNNVDVKSQASGNLNVRMSTTHADAQLHKHLRCTCSQERKRCVGQMKTLARRSEMRRTRPLRVHPMETALGWVLAVQQRCDSEASNSHPCSRDSTRAWAYVCMHCECVCVCVFVSARYMSLLQSNLVINIHEVITMATMQ